MTTIYVEFNDSSKTEIQVVFAGPQDQGAWSHLGDVDSSSSMYRDWFEAQPVSVQPSLPQPTE